MEDSVISLAMSSKCLLSGHFVYAASSRQRIDVMYMYIAFRFNMQIVMYYEANMFLRSQLKGGSVMQARQLYEPLLNH